MKRPIPPIMIKNPFINKPFALIQGAEKVARRAPFIRNVRSGLKAQQVDLMKTGQRGMFCGRALR